MRFSYILLVPSILFSIQFKILEERSQAPTYQATVVPKKMSSKVKKERFFYLIIKPVNKVYYELVELYNSVERSMIQGRNSLKIKKLKERYRAKTDLELLQALKPHPRSIVIAQAIMESAWATSRFFVEANNIFGMWSINPNEPRIAANVKRNGTQTIWLRKFYSIEESIREYYKLIGRGRSFREFREIRYQTDDPLKIITKLDKYSEIGDKYAFELMNIIEHNNLQKYD